MFKKWIISLLVVAGFQAVAVDADFSGEYRLRVNTGHSQGDIDVPKLGKDIFDSAVIRSKISGSFRPNEALEGNVTVYSNFMGVKADNNYLAYGNWMMSDEWMLKVGRTTYQIAQGQVIGTNDYQDFPVQFNGTFLTYSSEVVGVDVALASTKDITKEVEKEGTTTTEPVPLYIFSLDVRALPEWVKTINVHLVGDVMENFPHLGATLTGDIGGGIGYTATLASTLKEFMENETSPMESSLIDVALGYTYEWDSSALKFYLGYHQDGEKYDPLVYNEHKYAGKLDLAKWGGGLSYVNGGLAWMINSDSKVGAKALWFTKTQQVAEVKEGDIEIDTYFKHSFDSSVALKVWFGVLLKNDENEEASSKAEVALQMRF